MITYSDDQDDDVTMMLIMIIYNVDQDEDFSICWNLNAREGLGLAETLALR